MSYKAVNWAWDLDIKATEKMILVALADMADEQFSCFPGQEKLARMTGNSERTVRRVVQSLEGMGLVERAHRRRPDGRKTSDRYYLQVGTSPAILSGDKLSPDNDDRLHRTNASSTPLIEPSVESSDLDRSSIVEKPLYSDTFETWWKLYPRREAKGDAFRAWEQLRESKHKPTFEVLCAGARDYALRTATQEQKYKQLPGGWIRARRWEDEAPTPAEAAGTPARKVKKFQRREEDE
ncbi:helix-turn-helix domain-containing protein [Pseudoclavibacter helvolus]|uniref:helix-turn-helix domain-containing protein n=1 Tax=Pseudoclavibacter helvolus TaxID=255205 RepID=UPI003C74556B